MCCWCVFIFACCDVCMYAVVNVCMDVCLRVYICVCVCLCTYLCVCVCVLCVHVYDALVSCCLCWYESSLSTWACCVCMHIHLYVCTCVYKSICGVMRHRVCKTTPMVVEKRVCMKDSTCCVASHSLSCTWTLCLQVWFLNFDGPCSHWEKQWTDSGGCKVLRWVKGLC